MTALVLGGGIVGLWTADSLQRRGVDVKVISASDHSSTTSAAAVCVLLPFFPGDPASDVFKREIRWAEDTLQYVRRQDPGLKSFLELTTCYEFGLDGMIEDGFPVEKLDYLDFAAFEIIHLDRVVADCNFAVKFDCYLCNTAVYMSWLVEDLKSRGVEFELARVDGLDDLEVLARPFDVVLNCTGFSSLFPDPELYPVSGQSMFVPMDDDAPQRRFGLGAGHHAIFRHQRGFYLGSYFLTRKLYGIPRKDLYRQSIDFAGGSYRQLCESVGEEAPSIDVSRVERVNAGIRPFRTTGPRVEFESIGGLSIVHNYGHGAHGWTIGHATAELAAAIAMEKTG